MQIEDLNGFTITITDLKAAIEQADFYRGCRHANASPTQIKNDDERNKYWADLHTKLLRLQSEFTNIK